MIFCVDIDGTICNSEYGYEKATPIIDNIRKINDLYVNGHYIIYWTARGGKSGIDWSNLTKKQLTDWGCLYHELRFNKLSYDYIIDDKAIKINEL